MPDTAPSPAQPLAPIVEDQAAVHAILKAPAGEPQTQSTVCDLDVAGSLSLPDYTGGWRTVLTLDEASAVGVTCLICLGWLGARHTDPPVVVKGSWYPHTPPTLPGESNDAFTNRLTGAAARKLGAPFEEFLTAQTDPYATSPYDHRRNRQCSINWHNECSERDDPPDGRNCQCPCHAAAADAVAWAAEQDAQALAGSDDGDAIEAFIGPLDADPDTTYWPDLPSNAVLSIAADVAVELRKAMDKFPGQHVPLGFGSDAMWLPPTAGSMRAGTLRDVMRAMTDEAADRGRLTWLHVLAEEGFEAFAEDDTAKARAELVQLAAMAFRAILDIDHPRPVHFTGPSGVAWDQTGTHPDGSPALTPTRPDDVNGTLTPPALDDATSTTATGSPDA